jgi:V/A-type H+-transporting ATPase subunit I
MSIVKMKKLKLVALSVDRDALLRELQKQGCLEIREFDEPPEGLLALMDNTAEQTRLKELYEAKKKAEAALKILKKYAYVKSGLFSNRQEISESEFFSETATGGKYAPVREVISAEAKLNALYGEEYALTSFISSLAIWKDVNIPLQVRQTESSYVIMGAIPASKNIDDFSKALESSAEEVFLSPAGSDRDQKGLVLICSKQSYGQIEAVLKDYSFNRAPVGEHKGTAAENIAAAEKSLIEVKADIELTLSKLAQLGANRTAIKLHIDRLEMEVAQEEAQAKLLASQRVFALQGWVSQPDIKKLEALLEKYACAYELYDPEKGEKVPIRLQNNMLTRPLNMVTEMYSLPAYEGIDPNPLIMPFYIIFFGMMFNDLGYGLVLIALSLFIQIKAKPRGTLKYMMGLMLLCGVTTGIMGVLTGSFFGDSISVVAGMYGKTANIPVLLNPLDNPVLILIIAIGLGVIHILFGMAVKGSLWMLCLMWAAGGSCLRELLCLP